MKKLTMLIAGALVSTGLSLQPTGASADTVSDSELAYYESASSGAAVKSSTLATSATTAAEATAIKASACRKITSTVTAKNGFGATLYVFTHRTTWCYNGSKITYRSGSADIETHFAFWDASNSDIVQKTELLTPWIRFAKGKARHCIPTPWGSECTNSYPWSRHTLKANGAWSVERGIL